MTPPRCFMAFRFRLAAILLAALCCSVLRCVFVLSGAPSTRTRRTLRPARGDDEGVLDGTFKEVAQNLIDSMPLPAEEKEAHEAYRMGLSAQSDGDLKEAVRWYARALKLESDPSERGYILYNLGIVFADNGEFTKAAKYYLMAVDQNYQLFSAWNNLGVMYHAQGVKAERDLRYDRADALYEKAAEYWNRACNLAPGQYGDAERWLLDTGRAQGEWNLLLQRVNDTAVIVRRQATKILSAFVLNHPDHPDVVPVTLDLLRRSTDSEALRNLVLGTFELLWFMDDEPTPEAARQLCRVVDASRSMVAAVGDVLQELLRRFRKSIGSRKNSKGYEFAIRRWTTLILNEFVRTKCGYGSETPPFKKAKGSQIELQAAESAEEQWLMRRSLLSTLEAFSATQPKDLLVHLRPLTIYLALEDDSPPEDQWVAIKVCRILASVLPYVAERRGLMDHRQVQVDLQALIRNQPSSGVHEAVRCLCLVVKFVTGDLAQIVSHLNVAVPSLSRLCTSAEQKPGSLERIQLLYMSRQAWVLASIMECLNIDDHVQIEGLSAEEQPKRRLLPRSDLKFEFLGDCVASTVLDLLLRLNAIGEPQLRAVAASCMGFFLKGHRGFTKDRRVVELLQSALSSSDLLLCRKALETLSALLSHFRSEADRESKAGAADFADSRDGRIAGTSQSGHSLAALQGPSSQRSAKAGGSAAAEASSKTNSAIEAAQPLAAFADVVLSHITLAGSVGPAAGVPSPKKSQSTKRGRSVPETEEEEEQGSAQDTEKAEGVLRVRVEALSVVRHLHQQGLVNPMAVLPKVFALTFAGDPRLSEPATAMLKEMLELRPSLLLNRLDEAFREAFLALLSAATTAVRLGEAVVPQQLLGLGDVYMERFRKQKTLRDTFLRKALRELQRLQTNRSEERFAELAALGVVGVEDAGGSSATRKAGSRGPGRIPLRQQQQLLYAQFLASAVTSLPFAFENEPLLVVFECNHHLALHAGALLASADGTAVKEKETLSPEQALVFTEALSIVSCVVLKTVLRREYNLSSEQCATFNPKELRQERIKAFPTGGFGRGEDGQTPARNRFPANEWLEKISPLIENFGRPEEIISYIRTITDADPWDDSRSRHEAKLDVLEGRRGRKGKAAKGGKNELKATKVKKAEPPAARGRGRGRGEQKEKGNVKKKGRRKQGMCDSEDDSDWEEPGARKRPRVQEPAEADGAAQAGAHCRAISVMLRTSSLHCPIQRVRGRRPRFKRCAIYRSARHASTCDSSTIPTQAPAQTPTCESSRCVQRDLFF
ncbi:ycf3 [Symbiodinium sp. CCMP2592]|nr:ycf3 [Symbiodinium sp. CCMP2592]